MGVRAADTTSGGGEYLTRVVLSQSAGNVLIVGSSSAISGRVSTARFRSGALASLGVVVARAREFRPQVQCQKNVPASLRHVFNARGAAARSRRKRTRSKEARCSHSAGWAIRWGGGGRGIGPLRHASSTCLRNNITNGKNTPGHHGRVNHAVFFHGQLFRRVF